MSAFATLIYEKSGHVARITLNRPEVLNLHNMAMRDEMCEVLKAIKADDEIRVGIIMGAGEKAFCAGADLSEFLTAPPPVTAREVRFDIDLWGLFLSLPQPLIAAVHGYVLGSGLEIALCCDIRIAADNSRFGLPEVALGIIPAAGGTQTVPRTIGPAKTMEMLLTNRWLDAREALEANLVNMVVPGELLISTAEDTAARIAACDPLVIRAAKQCVVRGLEVSLAQGLELEARLSNQVTPRTYQLQA